ncbi:MAG: hypothetical protein E7441_01995 [Ruminococcaceae bacterium]|nr:hypothetical protein [Oscillospiraceae bacterium]
MDVKKEVKQKLTLKEIPSLVKEKIPPAFIVYPLNFFVSFLLSRGVILGTSAPFGLAVSAVLGMRRGTLFGLLGATLGYLSIIDVINSLKYIACIVLIYTAHFVFADTSLSKKRAFAPMTVIVPATCINLIFLADAGFPIFDCAVYAFEITIAAACTLLFPYADSSRKLRGNYFSAGILALCAAFTIALCGVKIAELISVGHILACSIILLAAYTGGMSAGAVTGLSLGFALSLAESSADFCMVYGLLGICTALFFGRNKYLAATLSCLFSLLVSVFLNPSALLSAGISFALSCIIFFLTQSIFARFSRRFFAKQASRRDVHIRAYTSERLKLAAESFRNLAHLLGDARGRASDSPQNEKSLFEKTSREVCKKCTLAKICWERDFEATRDAINNATHAIRENGTLSAKDFPIHFSSRCIHIENFVNTVNREIFSMRYRNQFEGRLRESHALLTKQYADASQVFSCLSADISDNARFDEEAELALSDLLTSYGILCDTAVYRDSLNHVNIHLCGKDLSRIANEFEKFSAEIKHLCGVEVSPPQYTRGDALDDMVIREKPRLRGVFGAAVKRRSGAEVSGDSGSFFRPTNAHLALLLSDGMGSGKLAAHESAQSVKLLEGLLKSGIAPSDALSTLQAALTLKAEYTGAFATLDLMYADMFTGACEFYKFGGAPTYIKRGRQMRRITASSLPAGMSIGDGASPDRTCINLFEGDFVIMASDGISDGSDDGKLLEFLSKTDETSPKALADAILAYSFAVYGKNDDMTVAVVKIEAEE